MFCHSICHYIIILCKLLLVDDEGVIEVSPERSLCNIMGAGGVVEVAVLSVRVLQRQSTQAGQEVRVQHQTVRL